MEDIFGSSHPLSWWRFDMGDASLVPHGLGLAARASRSDAENVTVLQLASEILRSRPNDVVLNGIATAISAVPSTGSDPANLSIPALAGSPSESMRSVGAIRWVEALGPAGAPAEPAAVGSTLARDPSPVVRRSLARKLAIAAAGSGLSDAANAVCEILRDDPRATVRDGAREALREAVVRQGATDDSVGLGQVTAPESNSIAAGGDISGSAAIGDAIEGSRP
jgi:hypothetical protein